VVIRKKEVEASSSDKLVCLFSSLL
jgi:hypothetical protein